VIKGKRERGCNSKKTGKKKRGRVQSRQKERPEVIILGRKKVEVILYIVTSLSTNNFIEVERIKLFIY